MNTERHEELAALAALDLLTPAEQAELTAALAQAPGLQTLIDSLRESAAQLAHAAPSAIPPAALKTRLLANIAVLPTAAAPATAAPLAPKPKAEILEFKAPKPEVQKPQRFSFGSLAGWAAAACFALMATWLGQNYLTAQKTNQVLRDQQTLADLTLRSTQNQLEAERLIAKREVADATAKLADYARNLAAIQARYNDSSSATSDLQAKLAQARTDLDRTRAQLNDAQLSLSTREARIADLDRQLKVQGDLASYKIATLASLAGNTPQAIAVAVWNPVNQQGVLAVQKLPALAADKDYQLWVIEGTNAPVSGGVFTVDPATGDARINFRPSSAIKNAEKFAISLERKGGGPKPEGPVLFLGQ